VTTFVAGVDRSDDAPRVLSYAAREAAAAGQPLLVVHAWTTPTWFGGVPGALPGELFPPDVARQAAEQLLERLAVQTGSSLPDPTRVTTRAVCGDAGRVLAELSGTAGLVVVGSHGEGPLRGALVGSVSHYLLHHSAAPVVLVPSWGADPGTVTRVVVGVDGSAGAGRALTWAAASADRHRCPLLVVHAGAADPLPGEGHSYRSPSLREHGALLEREAGWTAWLDDEVAEVRREHPDLTVESRLVDDPPTWTLTDAAGPHDQLVLGSRGRGGVTGLLLGSVATQCAHHARGVVVVVPAAPAQTAPSARTSE